MSNISAVMWDIDKVWYGGLSTSICASKVPCTDYIDQFNIKFIERGWYEPEDVGLWIRETGRRLNSRDDMAQMLTNFFYGLKRGDEFVIPRGRIAKEQIVEGKQAILRGLTMKQIREIADKTEYNPGLQDAVRLLRAHGVRQAGFSDGLGPFVIYKMICEGLDHRDATPAIVEATDGKEADFEDPMIYQDGTRLAGKVKPYKKGDAIFAYAGSLPFSEHAAIDDSAANIPTLKRIHEAGGVAVGYQVNDPKAFKEAGIPVLKDKDLRAFAEIVLTPAKISVYCE